MLSEVFTSIPTCLDAFGCIKKNLVLQLTGAVKWTQIMDRMLGDGANHIIEVGPGRVLQGLFKKVNREVLTEGASI